MFYGFLYHQALLPPLQSPTLCPLQVYIVNKSATRLPESFFLSARFLVPSGSDWFIEKLGSTVASSDVVLNGSRHTHGLSPAGGVYLAPSAASPQFAVALASLDAGAGVGCCWRVTRDV